MCLPLAVHFSTFMFHIIQCLKTLTPFRQDYIPLRKAFTLHVLFLFLFPRKFLFPPKIYVLPNCCLLRQQVRFLFQHVQWCTNVTLDYLYQALLNFTGFIKLCKLNVFKVIVVVFELIYVYLWNQQPMSFLY